MYSNVDSINDINKKTLRNKLHKQTNRHAPISINEINNICGATHMLITLIKINNIYSYACMFIFFMPEESSGSDLIF